MKDEFGMDVDEVLEIIKANSPDTTWSVALEMANKIFELSGDRDLANEYRDRYENLYRDERRRAEETRNNELDYFCGRHTFNPWEL